MYKLTITLSSLFFAFIIWIIYLANTGQHSIFFELVRLIPYGDKVGHLGLFGVLTLLANLATKFKVFKLGKIKIFCGSAIVFVFVTFEELSQHFLPTRTFDIFDYAADMLGILLFTWLSYILAKRNLTKCN
ncbi:VanZ family protein [Pseudoalteromonas sp. MMG024]|uniref:VanZ family protein n=1 Tax=Pseudoalteromonas sp. MMG024 TaxID=2909980 RepID=UPI001F1E8D5D|nr:VanZ family protein [Pseudoalteromonas sp. MMG024]